MYVVNLPTKSINQRKYRGFTQYFYFVKSRTLAMDKVILKCKCIMWWYTQNHCGHGGVNEFRLLTADQIVCIYQKKITLSLLMPLSMYMFK